MGVHTNYLFVFFFNLKMKDEFFKIFISSIKSYLNNFMLKDMRINYSYEDIIIFIIP